MVRLIVFGARRGRRRAGADEERCEAEALADGSSISNIGDLLKNAAHPGHDPRHPVEVEPR